MEKLDEQGKPILDKDGKPLTEEKAVQIPAFKVVSVFDVSQTEGEPLPSIAVNELSGSVQDYQDFFKALEQHPRCPSGLRTSRAGRTVISSARQPHCHPRGHEPVTDHQDGYP